MGAVAELLNEIRSWRKSASTPRRLLIRQRERVPEEVDPVPLEIPVGYEVPPTMEQLIQQYVRQEVSARAEEKGLGTFEDEDDFLEDDPEDIVMSGYEVHEYDMAPEEPVEDASPPEEAPEPSEELPAPLEDPSPPSEGTVPTDTSK